MKLDKAKEMLEKEKADGVHLLGGIRETDTGKFRAVIDGQLWSKGKLLKSDHFENERDFDTYEDAKANMAQAVEKLRAKYAEMGAVTDEVPVQ